MFRDAILAGGLALAAASLARAPQHTTPPVPEDALTARELIAWSNLQTPQPACQQPPAAQAPPYQDSAQYPQPTGTQDPHVPAQPQNRNEEQPHARRARSQ